MQIVAGDRRANLMCIAMAITLLGAIPAANAHARQAPPRYAIEATPAADEDTGGAIDLVFDDEHGLFVLRPTENAIVRIERAGEELVSTTWQDDVADPGDGEGDCSDLGPGLDTFCFDCPSTHNLFIYRPMTDATGIEFAAGTLVIPRTSGQLGLYRTSLRLWYACETETGPDDPADIAEYGVAPGSVGAFSLKIQAGLTGVVGGVIPNGMGSRTGSGSGGGGGGGSGGGPYPGIDENWELDKSTSYTSIGSDVAIADFNGDESEDLIILHPEENAASFLPFLELSGSDDTPGGAVFGSAVSFETTTAPTLAAPGDFDGDGAIDVAIAGSARSIQLHFGDGMGNFSRGESIPVGVAALALEALDVEGDGRSELLLSGGSDAESGTLIIAGLDASGQSFIQSYAFEGVPSALAVDEFPDGGGSSTAGLIEVLTSPPTEVFHFWGRDIQGMGSFPRDLTSLEDIQIGSTHLIALDATGEVFCWGANNYGESSVPSDLGPGSGVAAGIDFSIALEQDGSIRCWGRNQYGQCDVPDGIGPVQMVRAGWFNAAAVETNGRLHVWGWNSNGQNDVPQGLNAIVELDCGAWHIAALDNEGTVECWGWNSDGQCDVPSDLGPVIDVAAGYKVTLALLEDGTVRAWGSNYQIEVPDGLEDVVAIDAGEYHAAALLADGSVVCWGANFSGATEVPAGLGVTSRIACGLQSTFAQSTDTITTAHVHWLDIEATSGNPADLNGDGRIDGEDLLILLGNWAGPGAGDFDSSGMVDGADLLVLLGAWS